MTTQQVEDYISKKSGIDFSSVFNQYLRSTKVPTLEYSQKGEELKFRYTDIVKNLKLPLRIDGEQTIIPTEQWQTIKLKKGTPVQFNKNYYIHYKKVQ